LSLHAHFLYGSDRVALVFGVSGNPRNDFSVLDAGKSSRICYRNAEWSVVDDLCAYSVLCGTMVFPKDAA